MLKVLGWLNLAVRNGRRCAEIRGKYSGVKRMLGGQIGRCEGGVVVARPRRGLLGTLAKTCEEGEGDGRNVPSTRTEKARP